MAHTSLAQFQQLVLQDLTLQARLREVADRESFVALVLRLGAERGCPVGAEEVEAALRSRQSADPPIAMADVGRLAGWIPVRICWQQSQPIVEWRYAGDIEFSEPFFDQTIRRCLRQPFSRLFSWRTPIDTLAQLYAARPGLPPSGFVFHMSRCGSTLIAQMLAALPQTLVIAEAEPIDAVLRANFQDTALTDEQRIDWLRWVIGALGQPRGESQRHYVVKFDSWSILALPLIQRAFPNVPWIFVYRDPLEVLVSHYRQPGSQMVPGTLEPALLGLDAARVGQMPLERYYAAVLERVCQVAARHYQPGSGKLVNYRQLPRIVWSSILDFFHMRYTAGDVERMRYVTQFHAKNPALFFESDTNAKQSAATDQLRGIARRRLEPLYTQLEELRRLSQEV
jgi:hypothetical protein